MANNELAHVGTMGMKWGHRSGGRAQELKVSKGGDRVVAPDSKKTSSPKPVSARKAKDQSILEARKQIDFLGNKMVKSVNKLPAPTSEAHLSRIEKTKDYATALKDTKAFTENVMTAQKYTTKEKVKTGAVIAAGVLATVGYGFMSAYLRS